MENNEEICDSLNDRKTDDFLPCSSNLKEFKEEGDLIDELESDLKESTCSMKEGSIQGSVFTLSSLALGTGAFAIPIRCTQIGCFWFSLSIILVAFITFLVLSNLIKSARTVHGEEYSTSVKRIIGKIPAILIDIILMLYLFGVIIQFNVIIYSLIGRSVYEFFIDKQQYTDFSSYNEGKWNSISLKYPIMFGLSILLIPLCLLKDISKMRFASMLGICSLCYSIIVIIIESPWFYLDYRNNKYKKDEPKTHANWFDITKGFTSELNFFTSIATVFFIFACHQGAFPVYKSLKNNNEKRINKVFFRSIFLVLIIYLFVAICGFMTDPISQEPLIIFRKSIFKNDFFMNIAKISLALDLYLSIPANYNSFRASFFLLVFNTDKIDTWRNVFLTIPFLLLTTFIGAIFEDILSYISLLGGFCCSIICFIIPGSLIVASSKEKVFSLRNILILVILGILGTL
jgi:amino acid permease